MSILAVAVALVIGVVGVVVVALRPRHGTLTRAPVDDFVVGDMPMICVHTGQPADGLVEIESDEGRFQVWWLLLLLLGPIGIIAMVALAAMAPRPGRVSGALPMTHGALDDHNRQIRAFNWAWGVPIAALLVGAVLLSLGFGDWVALAATGVLSIGLIGGFVTLVVVGARSRSRTVKVRLDGTRRWVEIINAHPGFVEALNSQVRGRHRAARRELRDS